jgi:hypothetical protein
MTRFQIEKRYYRYNDWTGQSDLLTESHPVLYPTLEAAKARYELGSDPWFSDQGDEDPYFAISEIEPSGFEVGYHPLTQVSA